MRGAGTAKASAGRCRAKAGGRTRRAPVDCIVRFTTRPDLDILHAMEPVTGVAVTAESADWSGLGRGQALFAAYRRRACVASSASYLKPAGQLPS